jgi:hypothetical protein
MCTGVLPVRQLLAPLAAFWRSNRCANLPLLLLYLSSIYPRHVTHVQSCSSSRYRNHSRNVLTIDSLRSTSLTPVDVSFSVVRYS